MSDTIAAIATGNGLSAIGIIRLSGPMAIQIADAVFCPMNGRKMEDMADRTLHMGLLYGRDGTVIDSCLCTVSRGPGTYTGEDTAEFQCHGSPTVLAEGLAALFQAGARQAAAGEYTKRAFLNGRMDLSQAEAVIDLIEAETAEAAKNAVQQLGRSISRKTDAVYDSLRDMLSHFHAVLDYPDEDIDDFAADAYLQVLRDGENQLSALLDTFERGKMLKNGVKSVIIGRPNVGKSSLLNALLGYDRAIVTEIAGTTRDTIEEKIRLGKTLLVLADTAGIHATEDTVEKLGVQRAIDASEAAQFVLAVFDGSQEWTEEDAKIILQAEKAPKRIAVVNKADLPCKIDTAMLQGVFQTVCHISAKLGTGLEALTAAVTEMFPDDGAGARGEILTNARQAEAVERALKSLQGARKAIAEGITPDAALIEIEDAMQALGEISGRTVRDDVTARIFERFCVGK